VQIFKTNLQADMDQFRFQLERLSKRRLIARLK
jgi:hypothetical protein